MTPKQTLLTLLRLAKDCGLDPLKEEVALALYENCQWPAYITAEGYAKLLNHHPLLMALLLVNHKKLPLASQFG